MTLELTKIGPMSWRRLQASRDWRHTELVTIPGKQGLMIGGFGSTLLDSHTELRYVSVPSFLQAIWTYSVEFVACARSEGLVGGCVSSLNKTSKSDESIHGKPDQRKRMKETDDGNRIEALIKCPACTLWGLTLK